MITKLKTLFHDTNSNYGRKKGEDGYSESYFTQQSEQVILENLNKDGLIDLYQRGNKLFISPQPQFWQLFE